MRGQVLGVDVRTGDGIVLGDDGTRYSFRPDDWAHRGEPAIGLFVDFEVHESRALSIFPVPGSQPVAVAALEPIHGERNKYIAAVLAFVVGYFGVHRFYLGRTGSGIAMLLLTCSVIGTLVSVPWALIDTIRFLGMSDREFARRYERDDD